MLRKIYLLGILKIKGAKDFNHASHFSTAFNDIFSKSEISVSVFRCVEYDFDIKWSRDTWSVDLVGQMWTKQRESLNRNIALVSSLFVS